MTKLTGEQRNFIKRFITNKGFIQASRIKSQYEDYERRRSKIELEIEVLPPDNPALQPLRDRIAKAKDKAKDPNDGRVPAFDVAFADLESVKRDVRAAAKGYQAALSPDTIRLRLNEITAGVTPIRQLQAGTDREMKALIDEVKAYPVPPLPDYDAIVAFQASLTGHKARWLGTIDSCRTRVGEACALASALGVEAKLEAARHDLNQLKAKGGQRMAKPAVELETRLAALTTNAKPDGKFRTKDNLRADFDAAAKAAVAAIQTLSNSHVREGGPDLGDRFAEAARREREILDRARLSYQFASATDKVVLSPKTVPDPAAPPKPKGPPAMARFNVGDMVDDSTAQLHEDDIDEQIILAAAFKAKTKAVAFIATEAARTPNSDKLFDMAMRSLNDLRQEMAATLGLTGAPAEWPENSRRLAEELAMAVKAAVAENSPNRPSATKRTMRYQDENHDVPVTVAVNGVTYDSPEILGKGGLGLITRYKGPPVNGRDTTVVMKSVISGNGDGFVAHDDDVHDDPVVRAQAAQAGKRGEMVAEMRVHRALMGGEGGTPNPNVVAMKGAAVGADGSLHMIMEEAQAGDAKQFGDAMDVLTRAGFLPKAAQQAMKQDTMLQAVRGLKAMHDLGVMHNDLKAVNYLVDIDGTVKAADFGSGETFEQAAANPAWYPATTTSFATPEYFKNRSEKSDIFALGSMLHGIDAEIGVAGKVAEGTVVQDYAEKATTGHTKTSLDRLRNAMMSKNPDDRPTLEGILMSSYLNDARSAFGDPDGKAAAKPPLKELRQAAAAYAKAVGREISKLNDSINVRRGEFLKAMKTEADQAKRVALAEKLDREVAKLQADIDGVNARQEIAPLLAEVKRVGETFGTAKGSAEDNAWDFAYRQVQDDYERAHRPEPQPMPADLQNAIRNRAAREPAAAAS